MSTNVVLWNKIWKHDLIEKYHIRFPEGHEHDDDAFWYMYAFVAKNIFYLKKPLYHYFLRTGSIMSTQFNKQPKNRMDRINITDYVLEFLLKNNLQKYTDLMVKICRGQLSGSRKFFTENELTDLCSSITKKLQTKLLTQSEIIYRNGYVLCSKNKSIIKLIYGWIYYHLCSYFWRLIQTPGGEKHYTRYIHRIQKNKLYWKLLIGRRKK